MKNNLYLVHTSDYGYDDYDSIIIVAENEADALAYAYGDKKQLESENFDIAYLSDDSSRDKTSVMFIGQTDFPLGAMILGSFNAG